MLFSFLLVNAKQIALTFDDGPDPNNTPMVLDILDEYEIKATFFVVGYLAKAYPEILQEIIARGHTIGNHTWNHPFMTRISSDNARSQLERTNQAILSACPEIQIKYFRPPYLDVNDRIRAIARDLKLITVMATFDCEDYRSSRSTADIVRLTLERSGGEKEIMIIHDGVGPSRQKGIAALSMIIELMREQGYEFVTLDEILKEEEVVEVE